MNIYNNWFFVCVVLILTFASTLIGFSMGQQASADNCKRFGMFHYSGVIYSCQQVRANEVVAVEFKESAK